MMGKLASLWTFWLIGVGLAWAVESVDVVLHPHADAAGKTVGVSFGLPVPPGVLMDGSAVSIMDARGRPIEAHTRVLGSWTKVPPPAMRCNRYPSPAAGGVRSIGIEFPWKFASPQPVKINVKLGRTPVGRLAAPVEALRTLRAVSEGSYQADLGLQEPIVYATLPADWLCCSLITPLLGPAGEQPLLRSFEESRSAYLPFMLTMPTQGAPGTPFLTDAEVWLYDRPQVFLNGYISTGELAFLREGYRAARHYVRQLYRGDECGPMPENSCRGYFKLKNPPALRYKDSKYSYGESIASLYWLTGDDDLKPRLSDVVSATRRHIPLTTPFDSRNRLFTERNYAHALLTELALWEVTGDSGAEQRVRQAVGVLRQMQETPIEEVPPNGCFNYHVESNKILSFSPWMSSLLAHSLVRAYQDLGDARIPQMLASLAQCVADRGLYEGSWGGPVMKLPRYIAAANGEPQSLGGNPASDREHAVDVAALLGLGAYFAKEESVARRLRELAVELVRTHDQVTSEWRRGGRAIVRPPRKYNWWYKNSGTLSRTLSAQSGAGVGGRAR